MAAVVVHVGQMTVLAAEAELAVGDDAVVGVRDAARRSAVLPQLPQRTPPPPTPFGGAVDERAAQLGIWRAS